MASIMEYYVNIYTSMDQVNNAIWASWNMLVLCTRGHHLPHCVAVDGHPLQNALSWHCLSRNSYINSTQNSFIHSRWIPSNNCIKSCCTWTKIVKEGGMPWSVVVSVLDRRSRNPWFKPDWLRCLKSKAVVDNSTIQKTSYSQIPYFSKSVGLVQRNDTNGNNVSGRSYFWTWTDPRVKCREVWIKTHWISDSKIVWGGFVGVRFSVNTFSLLKVLSTIKLQVLVTSHSLFILFPPLLFHSLYLSFHFSSNYISFSLLLSSFSSPCSIHLWMSLTSVSFPSSPSSISLHLCLSPYSIGFSSSEKTADFLFKLVAPHCMHTDNLRP